MRTVAIIITVLMAALAGVFGARGEWVFGAMAAVAALCSAWWLRRLVTGSDRYFTTLLEALRNADASMRFVTPDPRLTGSLNAIMDTLNSMRRTLQSREHYYAGILRSVPAGVIVADGGARILYANPRALELTGADVLTHAAQLRHAAPRLADLLEQGATAAAVQLELEGPRRVIDMTLGPVAHSPRQERLVVLNDVTRSMDAAEAESWIHLSRVLNHEIINTFTPMMSLCDTLRRTSGPAALPADTVGALEAIALTGESLQQFVAGFKSFTSLPEPRLRVEPLKPLLLTVATSVATLAPEAQVRVECGDELLVCTDPGLLLRALMCVGANAARFCTTAPQGRRGSVSLEAAERPDGTVGIVIANNGEPVAPELVDRIFTPFFTTAPHSDGRGIGLTLARHIMIRLGGSLTLASTGEQGTSFAFALP